MVFPKIINAILIINILKTDENISVAERRKLASFPELSISKLFDKSFKSAGRLGSEVAILTAPKSSKSS